MTTSRRGDNRGESVFQDLSHHAHFRINEDHCDRAEMAVTAIHVFKKSCDAKHQRQSQLLSLPPLSLSPNATGYLITVWILLITLRIWREVPGSSPNDFKHKKSQSNRVLWRTHCGMDHVLPGNPPRSKGEGGGCVDSSWRSAEARRLACGTYKDNSVAPSSIRCRSVADSAGFDSRAGMWYGKRFG